MNSRIDAIYARQSVDKKDFISIESQIEFCKCRILSATPLPCVLPCKLYFTYNEALKSWFIIRILPKEFIPFESILQNK